MHGNYWQGRWDRGQTGWHQTEVEPALVHHFSAVPTTRVLVPLCGKSLDLKWLTSEGHDVIGVELSELGCRAYFEDNGIPYEVSQIPDFSVYRGERITLYQGDFFSLREEHLTGLGAVYDRAALIAFPADIRVRYAAQISRLVRACAPPRGFHFLQITLERTPADSGGPPFSVSEAELRALYETDFDIAVLSREPVEADGPPGCASVESVFRLSLK